jgi:hypothetical protein
MAAARPASGPASGRSAGRSSRLRLVEHAAPCTTGRTGPPPAGGSGAPQRRRASSPRRAAATGRRRPTQAVHAQPAPGAGRRTRRRRLARAPRSLPVRPGGGHPAATSRRPPPGLRGRPAASAAPNGSRRSGRPWPARPPGRRRRPAPGAAPGPPPRLWLVAAGLSLAGVVLLAGLKRPGARRRAQSGRLAARPGGPPRARGAACATIGPIPPAIGAP